MKKQILNGTLEEVLEVIPNIRKIVWKSEYQDLTFYYEDSTEPFCKSEFIKGSVSGKVLDAYVERLIWKRMPSFTWLKD